jgi:hypothetical protein
MVTKAYVANRGWLQSLTKSRFCPSFEAAPDTSGLLNWYGFAEARTTSISLAAVLHVRFVVGRLSVPASMR